MFILLTFRTFQGLIYCLNLSTTSLKRPFKVSLEGIPRDKKEP